jgi:para-aminobenzoate synthetase component 1
MIRRINKLAENRIPFLLIVDFEMRMPVLFPLDELPPDIRFSTPSIDFPDGIPGSREKSSFATSDEAVASPMRFKFAAEPIPYTRYLSAFNLVREYALMGRTYLTNLTFPTRIRTRLSLGEIYTMSRAKYKLLYGDRFVVFSPEIFVQIRDGQIRSFPMKGTIDADITGARDRVRVEKFRYIDTLVTSHKKLLQVSSVIAGQLPDNYLSSLGEIIFSMLPAGSVSGAPKAETLRIIREAEGSDRGYYTGIMGFFNGKDFDSAVMIRYIENRSGQLFYRSGGGITFLSDPEKEYRELIDKVYMPIA